MAIAHSSWKLRGRFVVALVLSCWQAAGAQEVVTPSPLTLEDCIAIALANQPAIKAREAAVRAACEQQNIAHSYSLPQVTFSSRYTALDQSLSVDTPSPLAGQAADVLSDAAAYFGIARQAGPAAAEAALANPNAPPFAAAKQAALASFPGSFRTDLLGASFLTTQLAISQPIWTGGKITYREQQAALGTSAASEDVAKSRQETIFNVTKAYVSVSLADALLEVADETEAEFWSTHEIAAALLEELEQTVTEADVFRPASLRASAESERIRLKRGRELAIAALRQAMGLPPDADVEVSPGGLQFNQQEMEQSTVIDEALRRRPELAKANIGVRIAELQRALAKASFYPDIAAFGSVMSVTDDQDYLNPNRPAFAAVGIAVEVPLSVGGRRLAERRQAEHQQRQAHYTRQLARELIALEAQQAYLEYKETSERLAPSQVAKEAAEKAMEDYHKQYRSRSIKATDMPKYFENVMTTRILLTQAQVNYWQLIYSHNLALAKLQLVTASNEYRESMGESRLPPTSMATASGKQRRRTAAAATHQGRF